MVTLKVSTTDSLIRLNFYQRQESRSGDYSFKQRDVNDPIFKDLLGEPYYSKLIEDIELLDIAGDSFDLNRILKGELTPIFFGSAMTNFGVEPFLEEFLRMSPPR